MSQRLVTDRRLARKAALVAALGLPIDAANYILGCNDHDDASRVEAEFARHDVTAHRVFGVHNELGGSILCATHPLVRSP